MSTARPALMCVLALVAVVGSSSVNPIRKVVTLMQDMQKEIANELEKEKGLFEKFMCICTEHPKQLAEIVETNEKR